LARRIIDFLERVKESKRGERFEKASFSIVYVRGDLLRELVRGCIFSCSGTRAHEQLPKMNESGFSNLKKSPRQ
jgi:hypothetical protein